jgi:hypothetical protein
MRSMSTPSLSHHTAARFQSHHWWRNHSLRESRWPAVRPAQSRRKWSEADFEPGQRRQQQAGHLSGLLSNVFFGVNWLVAIPATVSATGSLPLTIDGACNGGFGQVQGSVTIWVLTTL